MTNTIHKTDDSQMTNDWADEWVSKECADAMSAASYGDSFPAGQEINGQTICTRHRMNRDAALAVLERIAKGQFDDEALMFIQIVAQSMVNIEKATEDEGVTNETRTDYLAKATGLLGTRDKYKKLRDALAIYEFLPSDTSDAEKLKRRSKIGFLQSAEGVELLEAAGKAAPSTKNITPWSELLRQIEGRRKKT